MKVKDIAGNEVAGVIRLPAGGLAVNNTAEYEKYKRDKLSILEFNELKNKVNSMETMLQQILEKLNAQQ